MATVFPSRPDRFISEDPGIRLHFAMDTAREIVPNRLYWAEVSEIPRGTSECHFFSTDDMLSYEPFFEDFGPLHLGMVITYCHIVEDKLDDPQLKGRKIIHCCSSMAHLRTNAACLICAYQVLEMGRRAEHALWPFQGIDPPLMPYRDTSWGPARFHISVLDVLRALQGAVDRRWLDWRQFDVESFEHFSRLENGDMNWIVPGKVMVFAEPSSTPLDGDGDRVLTPADYMPFFRDAGIGLVARGRDASCTCTSSNGRRWWRLSCASSRRRRGPSPSIAKRASAGPARSLGCMR